MAPQAMLPAVRQTAMINAHFLNIMLGFISRHSKKILGMLLNGTQHLA
jgi:hypothetical protein